MRSTRLRLALPCALGLAVAACATHSAVERSREYAADGNYRLAYLVLDEARTAQPGNPDLEREWRAAQLEYLIDQARGAIFAERVEAGRQALAQAAELAPGNPIVQQLQQRANEKAAQVITRRGDRAMADGKLDEALQAYTAAQQEVPGYKPALEGTQKVRVAFDRMHNKAQEHFLEALRRFPELRWVEVNWHATTAMDNDKTRTDVQDLAVRAQRKLAEKTFARARASEKDAHYGAALMDYKSVRLLQADFPAIDDCIERMQKEVQARVLVESAFLSTLRLQFAQAEKQLTEAATLSTLERAAISDVQLQVRKKAGELRYREAKDLELQNMKREALAAYRALAKDWPDGLLDEKVRIDNLDRDIEAATKAFAAGKAAEEAGDRKAALEQYETADSYYPDFQGVKAKIQELKKPAGDKPAGGEGQGEPDR